MNQPTPQKNKDIANFKFRMKFLAHAQTFDRGGALISVIFSFLLRLGEVKYHWSKSGNGAKTVNQTYEERLDRV